MAGLKLTIQLKGLKEIRQKFTALRTALSSRRELHRRWGIQTLNWVDENFRTEGRLAGKPWAKLSPNTVAGRRKKSSRILQDAGRLRQSFTSKPTATETRVGTDVFYAPFHEEGGTRWYDIRPVNKKALAFPTAHGGQRVSKEVALESARTGGGRLRRGMDIAFSQFVRHPPLIQRKMLPTIDNPNLLARLIKSTIGLMKEVGPEIK